MISGSAEDKMAMKEVLEVIAKSLVDNPDEVVVTEEKRDGVIVLSLKVAQSDMGKVIGRSGREDKSIRRVINAAASHGREKIIVDIG